jgi:hypothetical protein
MKCRFGLLLALGLVLAPVAEANTTKAPPTPVSTPTPETPARPPTPRIITLPPQPARAPVMVMRREPREIDRKLSASPKGTISLENPAGSIVVTGWNQNQVRVTGTLGGGVKRMVFTRDGDQVTLKVVPRPNYPLGDESELEVHVPAGSRLDIKTFSASIEVNGLTGTVDMESMNGSINVSGAPRLVHARCVQCDMELETASDVVRGENMTGTITVSNARGLVDLSTVSGNIEMEAEKATEVKLSAVSGALSFSGSPGRNASMVFQTHSGPINLAFPDNFSGDFDVLSYKGTFSSELGTVRPSTQKAGTAREYHFSTGSGGSRVHIETFNGPINIGKE